jgi:hypothetical protein
VVLIDDQPPVEDFPAQGADHSFADRVRPGRLRRAGQDPDARRGEHGIEGAGELARPVPEQEQVNRAVASWAVRVTRTPP